MKTILILLFTVSSYAQFGLYIPVNTRHFSDNNHIPYVKGQGGDMGFMASYFAKRTCYNAGVIRNSYGKTSLVLGIGLFKDIKKVRFSVMGGLASGYDLREFGGKLKMQEYFPEYIARSGIIPIVISSARIILYEGIGIQLNFSPAYVNTGICFKLDQ